MEIKPTLILIHGWGGSQKSLLTLEKELKNYGFNTLNLELPGHGKTEEMKEVWEMKDFANWLKSKIAEKCITNYICIGHSFGGKLILEGVTSKTINPQKIILINNSGIKPKNTVKKEIFKILSSIFKPIINLLPERVKFMLYKYLVRETDYIKSSGNLRESLKKVLNTHYDNKLNLINLPTLLIWGINDNDTPIWMGYFQEKLIQNAKLVKLEGTHSLPIKNPIEVAKIINNYIKND